MSLEKIKFQEKLIRILENRLSSCPIADFNEVKECLKREKEVLCRLQNERKS